MRMDEKTPRPRFLAGRVVALFRGRPVAFRLPLPVGSRSVAVLVRPVALPWSPSNTSRIESRTARRMSWCGGLWFMCFVSDNPCAAHGIKRGHRVNQKDHGGSNGKPAVTVPPNAQNPSVEDSPPRFPRASRLDSPNWSPWRTCKTGKNRGSLAKQRRANVRKDTKSDSEWSREKEKRAKTPYK